MLMKYKCLKIEKNDHGTSLQVSESGVILENLSKFGAEFSKFQQIQDLQ
jgi:hypothetical protein